MLNAMQNWAASRPRLHIWVGALGALPTHMKNRADAGRAADPNGQKADEIAVRLGRPVGVALTTAMVARLGEEILPTSLACFARRLSDHGFRQNP